MSEIGYDDVGKIANMDDDGLYRKAKWCMIAVYLVLALAALLLSGCGATVTVNLLSSHSRYGQAVGGTETTIKGQIEGGGNAATVPLSP